VNYTGSKRVSPIAFGGVTDAGAIVVSAGECLGEPTWLPTFGGEPGVNHLVYALTVFDDGSGGGPKLYAGGYFTAAGGFAANFIACWNGSTWAQVGGGVSHWVYALTVFDDGSGAGPALYAGGSFTSAGGIAASRIAKWNGSTWAPVGSGLDSSVHALTVFDDGSGDGPALYAGGGFLGAGAVLAHFIARWNGSTWAPVGIGSGTNGQVLAFTVFDDGSGGGPALYAGGEFTTAGGVAANRIAKWNGSTWSPLGSGLNGAVWALTVFDDGLGSGPALYAGGQFSTAGGVAASQIARWNGSTWAPLGSGVSHWVYALTVFDDGTGGGPALYAGGNFTSAGGAPANRIAKWNGSTWSPLGSGVNARVLALTVFDDGSGSGPKLFAGGYLTAAGGLASNYIASWNGTTWKPVYSDLGNSLNGSVLALTVFDDGSGGAPALYAGGEFTTAGGVAANRIARWNGSTWTPLGNGHNNSVNALTVFDDGSGGGPALYAGGSFTSGVGAPANRIAKWNGSTWSPLGSGLNNTVYALTVFDDGSGGGPELYAAGSFTTSGSVVVNRIAKWTGTTWASVGSGTNGTVWALKVFDDGSGGGPELYAGGAFTSAGGVAANRIAKWNGSTWAPLGGGMNNTVSAITVIDDGSGGGPFLFAGGNFTTAGSVDANRIAQWNGSTWSPLGIGMNNTVNAITVFDDGSGGGPSLYAGGSFTSAGGVPASRIAKWNGSAWSPLGGGVSSAVIALTVFDDGSGGGSGLFAGGGFIGSPAGDSFIAKWGCDPSP